MLRGSLKCLFLLFRICVTLSVMFGYVFVNYPLRSAIEYLLFNNREDRLKPIRHTIETIVIYGGAFLLAFLVPDISVVFGLVGSTVSLLYMFYLPGVFYFKYFQWRLQKISTAITILMLITGSVITTVSTTVILLKYIQSKVHH